MVTDEDLLAACRSAGKPGSESHRDACRLYRRSVLEWQAGTAQAQREYAVRSALYRAVALLAATATRAGWLGDYSGCGTHSGYNKHVYEKTQACQACLEGEREYSRFRKRVQRRAAKAQSALREAA